MSRRRNTQSYRGRRAVGMVCLAGSATLLALSPAAGSAAPLALSPAAGSAAPLALSPAAGSAAPHRGPICDIKPADNAKSISSAIARCPAGSTVMFPARRSYHQATRIEVNNRHNLVIDGNGSTFKSSAPNDPTPGPGGEGGFKVAQPNWRILRGDHVTLRNMTVVGNFKKTGERGIQPGNQYNAGIAIFGGSGVTVTDVTVRDVWGDFVLTAPAGFLAAQPSLQGRPTDVRVQYLTGRRAARMCVAATSGRGFWLRNSVLKDCWYAGVDLEIDAPGEPLQDVHILRNIISGYHLAAIGLSEPGNGRDMKDVEIAGNTTLTAPDVCFPTVLVNYRPEHGTMRNVVVKNNWLRTLYQGISYRNIASGAIRKNHVQLTTSPKTCGPGSFDPAGLGLPTPAWVIPIYVEDSPHVVRRDNTSSGF